MWYRKVNFENGPYTIDVYPNIPIGMARAAGIDQGIQITYNIFYNIDIDNELLKTITGTFSYDGAYSIRKNGMGIESHNPENVKIENKTGK